MGDKVKLRTNQLKTDLRNEMSNEKIYIVN